MNVLRRFLRKVLYGGAKRLRGYEDLCLQAVAGHLAPGPQDILRAQIAVIDLVQRFASDKLVVLHAMGDGAATVRRLPDHGDEVRLAQVRITASAAPRPLLCDVVLHAGMLSSLEFDAPPSTLQAGVPTVLEVRLLARPLVPAEPAQTSAVRGSLLEQLSARADVREIKAPASEARQAAYLKHLGAAVSEDYLELLRETNGFRVEDWCFHGINARRIVRSVDNFRVAAESPAKALCWVEQRPRPTLVLYDHIDDDPSECSGGFLENLIAALGNSGKHA